MTTTIQDRQASVGTEQVWREIDKASFAVLSQVTPAGEPRSSGVLYKSIGRRLYVAVGADSWPGRGSRPRAGRVARRCPATSNDGEGVTPWPSHAAWSA